MAAGISIGLFISSISHYNPTTTLAFTSAALIGSILPDIDNSKSKLGRCIGPGSWLVQIMIGHRTVFHAPALYLLLFSVITAIRPASLLILCGAGAGVASHLLLDMLNPAGIPLLWPIKKRFHILNLRSGGLTDWLLSLLFSATGIYLFIHHMI